MKSFTAHFATLLLFATTLVAQNSPPQVTNITLIHSQITESVTFNFDLIDAEMDDLELSIRISADSGKTWLVNGLNTSGDIGFPVTPGTGKSITWAYSTAQLLTDLGPGTRAFRARIIADDKFSINIQDIVAQVDSTRLVETLNFLEGTRHTTANPAHMQEVRDSLAEWVLSSGLQDWSHSFSYSSTTRENYVARYAGLTAEAETYACSGHYDCVNVSPGADDNGTATAAVVEALRVLSGYEFAHSMRFFAFDAEELGLRGSISWVQNQIPAWEDFNGLLNMEMIGFFSETANSQTMPFGFDQLFPAAYNAIAADSFRGNFLTNVANVPSTALMQAFDTCAALYVPELRVVSLATPGTGSSTPDLRRSDHAPFWDAGLPALMLTDGADFRNPNYHTAGDSVGTLDMQFFYRNVKAMVATLAKLAEPIHADHAVSDTFLIYLQMSLAEASNNTLQVWPNPSSSGIVNAEWENPSYGCIVLSIWNAEGKELAKLMETEQTPGRHKLELDCKAAGMTPGVYFLHLQQPEGVSFRKFILQ